jgi:hypothetical protein
MKKYFCCSQFTRERKPFEMKTNGQKPLYVKYGSGFTIDGKPLKLKCV